MPRMTGRGLLGAGLALGWAAALLAPLPDATPLWHHVAGWVRHTLPLFARPALLLLAATFVGAPIARRLGIDVPLALRASLGLAALQLAATALAVVGALGVMPPLTVLLGIAGVLATLRGRGAAWPGSVLALAAIAVLPAFVTAGGAPVAADELQFHHRFIEFLARTGGFRLEEHDPTSAFPQGLQALLAGAGLDGGAERAGALLIALLGLTLGAEVAVALVGTSVLPYYVLVAASAASLHRSLGIVSSDLAMSPAIAAIGWLIVKRRMRPGAFVLLGAAALGMKYTAALWLLPLGVLAIPAGLGVSGAIRAAVGIAVLTAPWPLRLLADGLPPFYPFAGGGAPAGLERAFRFNASEQYGGGDSVIALLRTPWDLFVLGREFDRRHFMGRLGPLPLLLLPTTLAVARSRRQAGLLLALLAGFALWAAVPRRVAYLLAVWPLLAAMTAAGAHWLGERVRGPGAWMLGALGAIAIIEAEPAWTAAFAQGPVATGEKTRKEALEAALAGLSARRVLDAEAGPEARVAAFFDWQAPPPRDVLFVCAEDSPTTRAFLLEPGDLRARLSALSVDWVLVRRTPSSREQSPGLTDAEFDAAFLEPLRRLDAMLLQHGERRAVDGPIEVWRLRRPPDPQRAGG